MRHSTIGHKEGSPAGRFRDDSSFMHWCEKVTRGEEGWLHLSFITSDLSGEEHSMNVLK